MDGTIASPLDLKDLCGCPLNPKDLLCFRQTSFTSNRKWHKSFGFEGLPSDLKTAPDLFLDLSYMNFDSSVQVLGRLAAHDMRHG